MTERNEIKVIEAMKVKEKYTVYAREADITYIMQDTYKNGEYTATECIGFHYGEPCHEPAPRGSSTGTQGSSNKIEKARIPKALCEHIVNICESEVLSNENI